MCVLIWTAQIHDLPSQSERALHSPSTLAAYWFLCPRNCIEPTYFLPLWRELALHHSNVLHERMCVRDRGLGVSALL